MERLSPSDFDVIVDRTSGTTDYKSRIDRLRIAMVRFASRALEPLGGFGISRILRLLGGILPSNGWTLIRFDDSEFQYPSGDYYWERLVVFDYIYEVEIDRFLREVSKIPWNFVDAGANFGYWSSRVSQGDFGERNLVAIEPNRRAIDVLRKNIPQAHRSASKILQRAVYCQSNLQLELAGRRHAGISLKSHSFSEGSTGEKVLTISLDDVLEFHVQDPSLPTIWKLDVEGSELSALLGAQSVLHSECMLILEDTNRKIPGEALRFVFDLGMSVFCYSNGRWVQINQISQSQDVKTSLTPLQQTGVNFFCTKSPIWKPILKSLVSAQPDS